MSILIKKYSALDEKKWDDFIHSSLNGTIFYLDNATYHKSQYIIDKFVLFQIPILYSGPYSYD